MKLAQLQAGFFKYCLGKGASDEFLTHIRGRANLQDSSRLDLYQHFIGDSLEQTLRGRYVKTLTLASEERVKELTAHFAEAVVSERSEVFLAEVPARVRREARLWGREDLADLATLENALAEVAKGEPTTTRGPEVLAGLDPETFSDVRLRFIPDHRLLNLEHDLSDLWDAIENGQTPPSPKEAPTQLLVWKQGSKASHAPLSPEAALAFRAASEGAGLGAICETLTESSSADAGFDVVHAWFVEGLVAEVSFPR